MKDLKVQKEFKAIWKIKVSSNSKYKNASVSYVNNVVSELSKTRVIYDHKEVLINKEKTAGVYLIYSKKKENVVLTYVGESKDIFNRLRKHIYNIRTRNKLASRILTKEPDINNLNFLILEEVNDINERLKKETYYIYVFRSKFTNVNKSLANKKMRCDFGHGVKRTYLTFKKDIPYLDLYIYGKCRNKLCTNTFFIG